MCAVEMKRLATWFGGKLPRRVAPGGDEKKFKNISVWKIVGFAFGGFILIAGAVWILYGLVGSPKPAEWVDTLGRSAALIVAAVVALPAAYITFKRQQGLERQNAIEQSKHQHDQAKEEQRQREANEVDPVGWTS